MEPDSAIFKRTKILGTACEFGLSLISLALSECMSHLGLNTSIMSTKLTLDGNTLCRFKDT